MTDIEVLLERQTRWQKERQKLSWPDKIRMAEAVRLSAATWSGRAAGNMGTVYLSPTEADSVPNLTEGDE